MDVALSFLKSTAEEFEMERHFIAALARTLIHLYSRSSAVKHLEGRCTLEIAARTICQGRPV